MTNQEDRKIPLRVGSREAAEALERLAAHREALASARGETLAAVAGIIEDVRRRGDEALIELTRRFDGVDLAGQALEVPSERLDQALARLDAPLREALELAASRIRECQAAILRRTLADDPIAGDKGPRIVLRSRAVASAGLYVPGGRASYPSTVLMNAIPAREAGVPAILLATPPGPDGWPQDAVLAAARLAGVDRVFRVGGAQAIAAFAFGTKTIPRVAMVAGPGNRYVAAAKQALAGQVGIDLPAGPSEVVIVAEADQDPRVLAWDLLAQAEHDPDATAVLIALSRSLAEEVCARVQEALSSHPRPETARESWRRHGLVLVAADPAEALRLADSLAPEHLQLCGSGVEALERSVSNAGAVFLGAWTPEVAGDYVLGPSHTLPTGGSARFASGLSAATFLRRWAVMRCDEAAFRLLAPAMIALARAENLEAHARSADIRG